jgi:IS5 family transposase
MILNFRHLLEVHDLCGEMPDTVNLYLASRVIRITTGTIVDATIIPANSSIRNENKESDPDTHQTRKGNQWYFGMNAHIGVDLKEGIVHSVCSTAASVSELHMLPDLLHGDERKVWGDGGYQCQTKQIREAAPGAHDMTSRRVKTKAGADEVEKRKNRTKARVRAKVEWPFRLLKRVFGLMKVRYRGLKKDHEWLLRGLRPGQSLPEPQAADEAESTAVPGRGVVVCQPHAATSLRRTKIIAEPSQEGLF